MINLKMNEARQTSPARGAVAVLRDWAGSRLGLLAIAGAAIVAGLGFDWSWLVAAGVAPLIVAVLPCVAMCALGLCMMGMGKNMTGQSGAGPTAGRDSAAMPSLNDNGQPKAPLPDPSPVDAE
jgi:hypothetical protein